MSSLHNANPTMSKAERAFREAFERLKGGLPEVLPHGARVSQNNVAKEAGRDPSALKKDRFPELVRDIQEWVRKHVSPAADPQSDQRAQAKIAELKATIASLVEQRDRMASELLSAKHKIFEQWQKIQRLEAVESSTVVELRGRR